MADYKYTQNTTQLQKDVDDVETLVAGGKVNSLGLSAESFSTSEKTKLSALPTNAQLETSFDGKQDVISDLSTIRSGAAAGATAYQKPSGGIPKSDLSSAVQTSLDKADTALQPGNVTQATGSSTTDVMSQKAITDALAGKASKNGTLNQHFAAKSLQVLGRGTDNGLKLYKENGDIPYARIITESDLQSQGIDYVLPTSGITEGTTVKLATHDEVSQLGQKVGHLYGEPTPAVLYTAERGWVESNGKVVFDSSTARAVSSYAPLQISENMPYSLTVSTSGTATKSFFIADSDDNILFTGPGSIQQRTITGVAPTGAAKIYINSTITPTIIIGSNIFTELVGVKSLLAATVETGVRELTHVCVYIPVGLVLSEGEIIYISGTNQFRRGTSDGYEVIAPSAGSLWKFKGIILEYTGAGMSVMRGEVVKISYFAAAQPSGITAGEFYYNTNQKVLYLFEFSYNSIPVIFSNSALYSYNGNVYFYDGNGLYSFDIGDYFDLDEPIFAPSPQLPANSESGSDFNCETVTSSDLHTALDALINSLQAPEGGVYYTPKFLTKYDVSGLDASGVYPIYTYEMGLKNRYAWRASNELYAWKNGGTIVYVDSCSPHIGDSIYSDVNRTPSGKTVASYNSTTQTMTGSDSVNYTRDNASNVAANMIWLRARINKSATAGTNYTVFNRADTSIGTATLVDSTHITFGGKTYERAECFDYHTDQMFTLFIWGNEHGPTSDPLEPSVILYRLAKDLAGGCRDNKFLAFLKHYCKIVFIPCANPWGCQYPRVVGRNNSNGVNLNRNYDTVGWAAQADSDKGSYAGSEAETQYIMNMCKRFGADISIDIHCLGFGNVIAEGLMYYSETEIPDSAFYAKTQKVLGGLGYLFDHRGDPQPANAAHASEWMVQNGMIGGVFEMNPGKCSEEHVYDGNQHTAGVMEACYTEMMLCVRDWMAKVNPAFNLSKMQMK